MKILVIGGTGAVGGRAIALLLNESRIEHLVAPTRKPLQARSKIDNPIVDIEKEAYADNSTIFDRTYDLTLCTLGTTIKKAKTKKRFFEIEHDLVIRLAERVHNNGCNRFIYCSSVGASKQSMQFYLKTKGAIEETLSTIGFKQLIILQPSLLVGANRQEFRLGERIAEALLSILAPILPANIKPTTVESVASTIVIQMADTTLGINRLGPSDISQVSDIKNKG